MQRVNSFRSPTNVGQMFHVSVSNCVCVNVHMGDYMYDELK